MSTTSPISLGASAVPLLGAASTGETATVSAGAPVPRRFTVDEYYRMAEAGILTERDRVELIDGEIIAMNPIGARHAECVSVLTELLTVQLSQSEFCVRSQNPIRLSETDEPQPDIAVTRRKAYRDSHPGRDDVLIAIEVADTTLVYDSRVKVPLYAKFGTPESWLVDLQNDLVEVRQRPNNGTYEELRTYHRGEKIISPTLPQLTIDVAAVLG